MKFILVILFFILIGPMGKTQVTSVWTEFDTIQKYSDKILVHYSSFKDSLLMKDSEAFLYPTTIKIPRFKRLPSIFTVKYDADSIVFHGLSTTYLSNRYYKTEKYDNGKLLKTSYFNSLGKQILEQEFKSYNNVRGPHVIGWYFIKGKVNVKRKQ